MHVIMLSIRYVVGFDPTRNNRRHLGAHLYHYHNVQGIQGDHERGGTAGEYSLHGYRS